MDIPIFNNVIFYNGIKYICYNGLYKINPLKIALPIHPDIIDRVGPILTCLQQYTSFDWLTRDITEPIEKEYQEKRQIEHLKILEVTHRYKTKAELWAQAQVIRGISEHGSMVFTNGYDTPYFLHNYVESVYKTPLPSRYMSNHVPDRELFSPTLLTYKGLYYPNLFRWARQCDRWGDYCYNLKIYTDEQHDQPGWQT